MYIACIHLFINILYVNLVINGGITFQSIRGLSIRGSFPLLNQSINLSHQIVSYFILYPYMKYIYICTFKYIYNIYIFHTLYKHEKNIYMIQYSTPYTPSVCSTLKFDNTTLEITQVKSRICAYTYMIHIAIHVHNIHCTLLLPTNIFWLEPFDKCLEKNSPKLQCKSRLFLSTF